MLILKNISKKYGKKEIFTNLNISFSNCGFYAIVGKSGCGKSTLLNIISGVDVASSGDIYYQDVSYSNLIKQNLFSQYRQNELGIVYQNYFLIDSISVLDNMELVFLNSDIDQDKINYYLKMLDIYNLKDKIVNELSGGERQRVAIARAMVKGAKIILADEPTGNLDEKNSQNVYQILKKLSTDHLVIIVTHDEIGIKEFADKIIDANKLSNLKLSFNQSTIVSYIIKPNINKIHINRIFYYSHKIFFSKKILLPCFLFLFLSFANILLLNFKFIDSDITEYNLYIDNNISNITYQYKYNDLNEGINIYKFIENEDTNLIIYSNNVLNFIRFKDNITTYNANNSPIVVAKYIHESNYYLASNEISRGKIKITDYLLESLYQFGFITTDNFNDIYVTINNNIYYVDEIIDTNYEEYIVREYSYIKSHLDIYGIIYLNFDDYIQINTDTSNYFTNKIYLNLYLNNQTSDINIIKYMNSHMTYAISDISKTINNFYTAYNMFNLLCFPFLIVTVILSILILLFYITAEYRNKKYNLAVLYSMDISKKIINFMFVFNIILTILAGLTVSIIVYYSLFPAITTLYKNIIGINNIRININIIGALIIFCIDSVLLIILSIITSIYFSKKEIIDLLYDR